MRDDVGAERAAETRNAEAAHAVSPRQEKFTPGPWHVEGVGNELWIDSEMGGVARALGGRDADDETLPNANLIAAAPQLLSALKLVRPVIERQTKLWLAEAMRERNEETEGKVDGAVSFLEEIDAAIAKAEGQ